MILPLTPERFDVGIVTVVGPVLLVIASLSLPVGSLPELSTQALERHLGLGEGVVVLPRLPPTVDVLLNRVATIALDEANPMSVG
jgi:hypothetical protein